MLNAPLCSLETKRDKASVLCRVVSAQLGRAFLLPAAAENDAREPKKKLENEL